MDRFKNIRLSANEYKFGGSREIGKQEILYILRKIKRIWQQK